MEKETKRFLLGAIIFDLSPQQYEEMREIVKLGIDAAWEQIGKWKLSPVGTTTVYYNDDSFYAFLDD